ncbi:MAG: DUF3419 family protein [Cryomorphaceae bacterium]|jgi:hypothetical protein|nr:DUF3419 family protein [Cryomorphaceae bacterium]
MPPVYYAQSWEDPVLLHTVWASAPTENVHMVASGGDHALHLLQGGIPSASLYDTEAAQLEHIRLKVKALTLKNRDQLLGYGRFAQKNGLLHAGRLERYLRLFSRQLLPLLIAPSIREKLAQQPSPEAQKAHFEGPWQTKRWQWFSQRYFSPKRVDQHARHPDLTLSQGREAIVPDYVAQASKNLGLFLLSDNPYLDYVLFGGHVHSQLDYLHRQGADPGTKLTLHHQSLQQALDPLVPAQRFVHASDILEGYAVEEVPGFFTTVHRACAPGSSLVFWDHRFVTTPPDWFLSEWSPLQVDAPDRVPFYRQFHAYRRL